MSKEQSLSHQTLRELEAGDYEMLLEFPPPRMMLLDGIDYDELYARAKMFFWLWVGLTLEVKKYKTIDPKGHSRPYAWSRLILVAGSYYDFLLTELLDQRRDDGELPPGFRLPDMKRYLDELEAMLRKPVPKFRVSSCFMLSHYVDIRSSAYFARLLDSAPLSQEHLAVFEASAHKSLHRLHKTTLQCRLKPLQMLGNLLLLSSADLLARMYDLRSMGWNDAQPPGLFSLLRSGELPGLAARTSKCVEQHGEKGIETAFEQQLLLLFRSFGFQTVPASRATKRIDLICVSDSPSSEVTILVEAKTSSRRYSLPASDSRAIREYVKHTRRALSGLPPLRLVLLVGPDPTPTIAPKLEELSRGCQVPCSYATAEVLAGLREAVLGPIPASSFVSAMVADGPIVSPVATEKLATSIRHQAKAYSEFVTQMLRLRAVSEP